jgi:hypothetical protein
MTAVEARKAIESFFTAFNNRDGDALQKTMHFPHVRINGQGRMSMIMDEYDVHESDVKVHFKIEFSRYKDEGAMYAVHESLWVVTRRDDQWGILARSSYAP